MPQSTTSDAFLLGLESLMRRTGQGHHLAATVIELTGDADLSAIREAAEAMGQRHPLLHAHLKRSPLTFVAAWHPELAQAVPVTTHRDQTLNELISRVINGASIDIFKPGPNLEIHVLERKGSHAIILLWPHSLFDAVGIDKLIGELDSMESTPQEDWGETNRSAGTPSELWKAAHPMIEEMRTFPAAKIRSLHQQGAKPGKACFEILSFNEGNTAKIRKKMAETSGELLMIPYFAALSSRATAAVISQRNRTQRGILVSLPIQRIANPDKRPLFHNHMAAWSLLLDHESLGDLKTSAKALYCSYASFMKRKLPAAMEALTKLNERCPSRFYLLPIKHYLDGEICSLFHSHTGKFAQHTTQLFGRDIVNAYHVPSVSTPPGIGIFFSERNEQLTCTLSWREGSLNARELITLRQSLLDDLGVEAPTVA